MLLRPILPDAVLVAEMDPRDADPATLHSAEQAAVEGAVDKRRREHAAGRLLARALLARLGVRLGPLLNDAAGAPLWPDGVVGSITHCATRCAVAVTNLGGSIGIDVEPAEPLPEGVAPLVVSAREHAAFAALPPALAHVADRLVFSGKEAFYKAVYPRVGHYLDFTDVTLLLAGDGTFRVTLLRQAPPYPSGATFTGRYRVADGHLGTTVRFA
jgi:4'-phosphopantetheinyl transferase EntD